MNHSRRSPPPLQPTTATKTVSALHRVLRRIAESEVVRAMAAVLAVAAVVILAGLAWLFRH